MGVVVISDDLLKEFSDAYCLSFVIVQMDFYCV